jgi:hypothetical protein
VLYTALENRTLSFCVKERRDAEKLQGRGREKTAGLILTCSIIAVFIMSLTGRINSDWPRAVLFDDDERKPLCRAANKTKKIRLRNRAL